MIKVKSKLLKNATLEKVSLFVTVINSKGIHSSLIQLELCAIFVSKQQYVCNMQHNNVQHCDIVRLSSCIAPD